MQECGGVEIFRLIARLKCRPIFFSTYVVVVKNVIRQGRITRNGSLIIVPRFIVRFSDRIFFSENEIQRGSFEETVIQYIS